MFSRVLFPALMEAGAGKQNAVVVIVARRLRRLSLILDLVRFSVIDPQPCQRNLIGVFRRISAPVGEYRRLSA